MELNERMEEETETIAHTSEHPEYKNELKFSFHQSLQQW